MKALAFAVLVGCAGAQMPAQHHASDAVIYLHSNVADAQVYVDGKFVGQINLVKQGIALDPGRHRVEIRHDDYFSRYADLNLERSVKKQLDLDLQPVLP
ncbi:MAG: PEGA domain-containing protein [Kofleriaceae bacterium]